MFDKLLTLIFGSANDRAVKALNPVVKAIEGRESWAQSFTDDQFPEQTKIFKERLSKGETLDDILVHLHLQEKLQDAYSAKELIHASSWVHLFSIQDA